MAKRLKGVPNLPFAPIVALLFGVVAAVLVFATPAWLLERAVASLGISSVLSAAQPPLGDTARSMIAAVTGVSVALLLWIIMRPIEKIIHSRRVARPVVPGAVMTPAAPAEADWSPRTTRSPIFAGDELGAPLMSDEALASGGELFLDQSMLDAPVAESEPDAIVEPAQAIIAEGVISENVGGIEFVSSEVVDEAESDADRDRLAMPIIAPAEPGPALMTLEWPTPIAKDPPVAETIPPAEEDDEPSLDDLLRRFESALDRRNSWATNPPPSTTVASLRSLIEASNKNAA